MPTPTDIPLYTPVPQTAGSTKLLLRVHWTQPYYNDFQAMVSDYNATQGAQDKIYITLERFVANQAGPIATFIADYQAGTQEDVYHLDDNFFPDLAARKFFQPPPKEIQDYIKENFLEKAVQSGIWDNQIMGYPTENQPHMLFMNKALLKEAGIDIVAQPPKTWDDIRRMAKEATKKDASGQKTQAGWITPFTWQATASAPSPSGCCCSSWPARRWSTPPGRSRSGTSPRTPPGSGPSSSTTSIASTAAARRRWVATMSSGSSARARWSPTTRRPRLPGRPTGPPGLLEEQHAIPIMSPDGSKTGNTSRNYHWLVSPKTKYPELAWKFSRWMNDGPDYRMQKFQTETFGFVPSVKNYPMPSIFPEQIKNAFTESMKQPNQTLFPVIKGVPRAITIMRDKHDALVLGKLSPKEYTEQLDTELKTAMKDAYDSL